MPKQSIDRRTFLLASGAAPVAMASSQADDPSDMAAFGRLAGLNFSETELAQADNQLSRLRNDYDKLRRNEISFEMSPSTHFDPFPIAHPQGDPTGRTAIDIPLDVEMPKSDHDLAFASVIELASLLRQGQVTSRKLTELCISRLKRFDQDLLCVVSFLTDEALAHADEMDRELAAGTDRGALHGIPYGAKDLFAWPTAPTTFGAEPYKEQVWGVKATPLQRLEEAGAVLCAKLSLGALAMGDQWFGGRTRNPYNPAQGSSGSSAGSASSVAAGLLPFALGTETLGSIVSPCRRCGVPGLRPTFGAVSRFGAMPLSWTMDKVGPIARTAVDAGIVFDAMRGDDGLDPSARNTAFAWQPGSNITQLRVGILRADNWPARGCDKAFIQWLKKQTKELVEVSLPEADYGSMLVMLQAEAAAAFDALTRSGRDDQLTGQRANDWPNQFRAARTIPAVEYIQASRLRHQLVQDMHTSLAKIDVLVAPTHGGPTLTATNLSGHPTYVLPVGSNEQEQDGGRPVMLSLIGQLDGEGALLALAEAWQQATNWHLTRPALTNK